jgi:hypothetical protein
VVRTGGLHSDGALLRFLHFRRAVPHHCHSRQAGLNNLHAPQIKGVCREVFRRWEEFARSQVSESRPWGARQIGDSASTETKKVQIVSSLAYGPEIATARVGSLIETPSTCGEKGAGPILAWTCGQFASSREIISKRLE